MNIETDIFEPIDSSNLREHIEERIRNAILNGTLRSGDHVVESALAEQLHVSRAPVREALSAMERDGLITLIPRRGYFVVGFSSTDIEEVYGLRSILETGALTRVIEMLTSQDIADLQLVIDQFGQAVQDGQVRSEIVNLDLAFHGLVCQKANNSRLYSTWQSMRHQTWLLMGVTSQTKYEYLEQPVELHQRILDAIVDKDSELAVSLLREHILDAQKRALASLKAADEVNQ